ncbi:MAG: hypothetical protein V9G18_19025 [Albidovulum sp.]
MAIFRKGSVAEIEGVSGYPAPFNLGRGHLRYRHVTEAGGLTQFGAAVETLMPGGQSRRCTGRNARTSSSTCSRAC